MFQLFLDMLTIVLDIEIIKHQSLMTWKSKQTSRYRGDHLHAKIAELGVEIEADHPARDLACSTSYQQFKSMSY